MFLTCTYILEALVYTLGNTVTAAGVAGKAKEQLPPTSMIKTRIGKEL